MLNPEYSNQFKRDYKKAKARGKNISSLTTVMDILLNEEPMPAIYRDHQLVGEWKGFRELHIAPDWLLVYRIADGTVYFTRTGTHADIFEE